MAESYAPADVNRPWFNVFVAAMPPHLGWIGLATNGGPEYNKSQFVVSDLLGWDKDHIEILDRVSPPSIKCSLAAVRIHFVLV